MGALPLDAGPVNDTAMLPSPAVAAPMAGAPGGVPAAVLPPPPPQATSRVIKKSAERILNDTVYGIMLRPLVNDPRSLAGGTSSDRSRIAKQILRLLAVVETILERRLIGDRGHDRCRSPKESFLQAVVSLTEEPDCHPLQHEPLPDRKKKPREFPPGAFWPDSRRADVQRLAPLTCPCRPCRPCRPEPNVRGHGRPSGLRRSSPRWSAAGPRPTLRSAARGE